MNKDKTLDPTQIAQLANAKAKGKRPNYFADPMAEQGFALSMSLMAELAVARERIDTLERLLVAKGIISASEVEEYIPDEVAAHERQLAQVEYSARVLRPIQQRVESMRAQDDLTMDEMAERLGEVDPTGNNDA